MKRHLFNPHITKHAGIQIFKKIYILGCCFFFFTLLTFRSWHFGCAPDSMLFSENAVLNVVFNSVIYGPCLWMARSLGPLRERAPWTSKEPCQLSSMPHSPAGLCWARRNLRADLVILPLWSHWNCVFTYCPWQESTFIMLPRHDRELLKKKYTPTPLPSSLG